MLARSLAGRLADDITLVVFVVVVARSSSLGKMTTTTATNDENQCNNITKNNHVREFAQLSSSQDVSVCARCARLSVCLSVRLLHTLPRATSS